jgi:hypothetical protein
MVNEVSLASSPGVLAPPPITRQWSAPLSPGLAPLTRIDAREKQPSARRPLAKGSISPNSHWSLRTRELCRAAGLEKMPVLTISRRSSPVLERAVAEGVYMTQSSDYVARFRANAALHGTVRNYLSFGLAYRVKRSSRGRWPNGIGV